ncbi:MAG: hypothetical protein ACRCVT_05100 [Leadbetterella sp.]
MNFFKSHNSIFALFSLFFIAAFVFLPDSHPPGGYDRSCWINWSNYIQINGLQNIYKLKIDYLPLGTYMLWIYAKIVPYGSEYIIKNIDYLKLVAYAFHLGSIWLCLKISRFYFPNKSYLLIVFLVLINVAYWYNSLMYGQWDDIVSFFILAAILEAHKKKVANPIFWIFLAINFKLQAIFALPLIILMVIQNWQGVKKIKFVLFSFMSIIIVQILIVLPFYLAGDFDSLWFAVKSSVGRYPLLSMSAYNMWFLFFKDSLTTLDAKGFWGHSYHAYGLLLFLCFSGLSLLPSSVNLFKKVILRKQTIPYPTEKYFLVVSICFICFFFFNTQMHSRYTHPVLYFTLAYLMLTNRWIPLILMSLAYFLNIEGFGKIFKGNVAEFEVIWFQPWFVACIYLALLIVCFFYLFSPPKVNKSIS